MSQQTGVLRVISDISIPVNRIVVNPNDGYDLGLMNSAHPVKLHGTTVGADGSSTRGYLFDGQLIQENNCELGTVLLNKKLIAQLGKPKAIRLGLDENRLEVTSIT